jgi:hypothetical protein
LTLSARERGPCGVSRVTGRWPGRDLDVSGQGAQIRPGLAPSSLHRQTAASAFRPTSMSTPQTHISVRLPTDSSVCPPLWERGLPVASPTYRNRRHRLTCPCHHVASPPSGPALATFSVPAPHTPLLRFRPRKPTPSRFQASQQARLRRDGGHAIASSRKRETTKARSKRCCQKSAVGPARQPIPLRWTSQDSAISAGSGDPRQSGTCEVLETPNVRARSPRPTATAPNAVKR